LRRPVDFPCPKSFFPPLCSLEIIILPFFGSGSVLVYLVWSLFALSLLLPITFFFPATPRMVLLISSSFRQFFPISCRQDDVPVCLLNEIHSFLDFLQTFQRYFLCWWVRSLSLFWTAGKLVSWRFSSMERPLLSAFFDTRTAPSFPVADAQKTVPLPPCSLAGGRSCNVGVFSFFQSRWIVILRTVTGLLSFFGTRETPRLCCQLLYKVLEDVNSPAPSQSFPTAAARGRNFLIYD